MFGAGTYGELKIEYKLLATQVARNERRGQSNGAMDEVSGKGQKASTHGGSVGVDLAAVERDCTAANIDATSVLPNNKAHQ